MKSLIKYLFENSNKKFTDIIVICDSELLLLRRANYMKNFRGKWCLPGGHIDKGEDSKTAVIRELYEETKIVIDKPIFWKEYNYSDGNISDIYYIILNEKPEVKISREHAQFKWVPCKIQELEQKYKIKFAGDGFGIIEDWFDELADDIAEY